MMCNSERMVRLCMDHFLAEHSLSPSIITHDFIAAVKNERATCCQSRAHKSCCNPTVHACTGNVWDFCTQHGIEQPNLESCGSVLCPERVCMTISSCEVMPSAFESRHHPIETRRTSIRLQLYGSMSASIATFRADRLDELDCILRRWLAERSGIYTLGQRI